MPAAGRLGRGYTLDMLRNRRNGNPCIMEPLAVYTVAVGVRYRAFARENAASFRARGYTGPFFAITDAPGGLAGVETVIAPPIDAPMYLRTEAAALIPGFWGLARTYLYVDADCLCVGNPYALAGGLRVQREVDYAGLWTGSFTGADWRADFNRCGPAACSGVVGFANDEIGREFLSLWNFENRARRDVDQGALNVVLHRMYRGRFEYFDNVGFYGQPTAVDLVHLRGKIE